MKKSAIYSFAALLVIASLLLSSCTAATPEPTATSTVPPTITSTPTTESTSTPTPKPTATLTPTATVNATATQQVVDFEADVQAYYDAKYITSKTGTYEMLEDKTSAWAKLNYYIWEPMGYSPTNFIIKSEISWLSASSAADSSGCGYVFRLQDNDSRDHYMFFISLKGYVEVATNVANRWKSLGRATYGNAAQKGTADVVLIVEDSVFRVLVNGKLMKTVTGFAGKLGTGDLAYTVLSGTNKSYGTQCKFKDTVLWTITK